MRYMVMTESYYSANISYDTITSFP